MRFIALALALTACDSPGTVTTGADDVETLQTTVDGLVATVADLQDDLDAARTRIDQLEQGGEVVWELDCANPGRDPSETEMDGTRVFEETVDLEPGVYVMVGCGGNRCSAEFWEPLTFVERACPAAATTAHRLVRIHRSVEAP